MPTSASPVERPIGIAPGVAAFATRTPTLPPATHTNSYALGEREILLVEPATPHEAEQRAFVEWARGLASGGRSLRAIFVTHHHIDHVAGARALSEELGLPLLAHRETALRMGDAWRPELGHRHVEDGDVIELDGATPQRWEALHTPGHAPGHLCLHEPRLGALVVGDMVASVGTILIEPQDGHMQTYLEQLERLSELSAQMALPAHGAAIEQPSAWFDHYISHRKMREAKVLFSVQQLERTNLDELVALAYDDTPREIWGLAKLSLEAHLIKLIDDGLVRQEDSGYVAEVGA
ncbi:MAG: MBL fold metallo-hydrolase [Myxococcales bacterium]|nr:MBL fold metallo-hydrolase [Myxococcales bacterium]